MNVIETIFLNLNLSWFLSKLLPYILYPIIGLVLGALINRLFKIKKKGKKLIVSGLLMVMLFGGYFAYSPIYQGDFSNGSKEIKLKNATSEIGPNKLTVITIPNCPFCYEAIDKMLLLKKRVPSLEIEYRICSSDSSSINWYAEKGQGKINVVLASDPKAVSKIANHAFPAFVINDNNEKLLIWSNSDFGVQALDQVEARFSN